MPPSAAQLTTTVEATVTSKGQVTLPKELRHRLGLHKGSRVRFSIPRSGPIQVDKVLYELEDLWRMADAGPKAAGVITVEEMSRNRGRIRYCGLSTQTSGRGLTWVMTYGKCM